MSDGRRRETAEAYSGLEYGVFKVQMMSVNVYVFSIYDKEYVFTYKWRKRLNKVVPVGRGYQEVDVWQEEGGNVIWFLVWLQTEWLIWFGYVWRRGESDAAELWVLGWVPKQFWLDSLTVNI